MKPLVSIVITTKNEEKNIENSLLSIANQSYKNIETIVVDNNSTDRTLELAKKYTPLVFTKGPERSAQRNFGMIEKASGRYVMYVDADMILSPALVERCVEKVQSAGIVALHIPEIVLGKRFFSRVRRFERMFYDGTLIDGARFFDRDAFIATGGFDESMSGPEDWDLDKKIKQLGRIGLIEKSDDNSREQAAKWEESLWAFLIEKGGFDSQFENVIYHNEAEFDLKKYLSKKGYYAKSFDTYVQKWGKADPDIRRQLGLWYRFFGVFLEKGKWVRLLLHPILTAGMYLLRFLVGLRFLLR